jgi:hypothetical protein
MKSFFINYVRAARFHGSLFRPEDTDSAILCVNINFFVDHTEPLEAFTLVRETID